ncbi:RagB/SusD family nutrient uptake outer membrane protein [Rufibacter glacialis]|uniref:RagB/SusD family nutrient uptake outer membrane protein n=1 Tax=Rufibacter glacialis TaxID=1259555 RepID=A0A5M8Q8N2_9BACT|nr:RagB/SusD family nutrient uptake outer membrane protein [Rufibacter glacialis]KAA6432315.1 RagB/SusD family nutrient uptake outer membrane protein [Rufibacter glacialis]GGK77661.1 membrane protein [Rufibacter glacialis]
MKKRNIRIASILASLLLLGTLSCNDFLEEELVGTLTEDYYRTEQGVEDLIDASYEPTRTKFTYEWAYALWNFGTDEFTHGDQVNFNYYNTYDSRLNANPADPDVFIHEVWATYYDGINRTNNGIKYLPEVQGVRTLTTPVAKAQRMGELRFLRGLYYFTLVQQFGAIPLVLEPTQGIRTEFNRAPVPEVYKSIISDLRFAADNLPATQRDFGRATKGAAQHFLAKAYLTRGSAKAEQRGQQPTDIDSAAYFADLVIKSPVYVLENDFSNLWALSSYDDNVNKSQTSKEIIFSAQWNDDPLIAGRYGNQTHMYYIMQYDNLPGMRRDIINGRPFRRLMPTDYTMDIYDRKNDSRFYKSFKLAWISNNPGTIPKWSASNAPDPSLRDKPKFTEGDTAAYIWVNTPATALTQATIDASPHALFPRYYRNSRGELVSAFTTRNRYPTLVKWLDPFRLTANQQQGVKDGILARLGETYLIAAEAYGRKGDYAKALEYINVLRQRAAYKAGEAKRPEYWLVEGGQKDNVASTYSEIRATTALFTTNAPSELYPSGVSSTADRFIHFVLNERTRELAGEFHRWEDLVRTESLLNRAKAFNPDVKNLQGFHALRPIPLQHLERLTVNGQPLNSDQRQAQQNPGY